jgi:hypothetical protein
MSVREIPAREWQEYLQQFSREHRAWLATVERVHAGGTPSRVEAVERPLDAVTPEVAARRVVGISIAFQEDPRSGDALHVHTPTHLRVDETSEGSARALEIEDQHGECTRIRFRSAPPPDMLDGIAPGEL